jgi:hypothetical protein
VSDYHRDLPQSYREVGGWAAASRIPLGEDPVVHVLLCTSKCKCIEAKSLKARPIL